MNLVKQLILFLSLIFLLSCSDGRINRISEEEFVAFVGQNKVGSMAFGSDYWLEKRINDEQLGETWAKLLLVFGYVGNFEVCEELANYLQDKYLQRYRCVPANKYERRSAGL